MLSKGRTAMLFSGASIKADGVTGDLGGGWLTLKKPLTARITVPQITRPLTSQARSRTRGDLKNTLTGSENFPVFCNAPSPEIALKSCAVRLRPALIAAATREIALRSSAGF